MELAYYNGFGILIPCMEYGYYRFLIPGSPSFVLGVEEHNLVGHNYSLPGILFDDA
jgi:hypothetical protein